MYLGTLGLACPADDTAHESARRNALAKVMDGVALSAAGMVEAVPVRPGSIFAVSADIPMAWVVAPFVTHVAEMVPHHSWLSSCIPLPGGGVGSGCSPYSSTALPGSETQWQ